MGCDIHIVLERRHLQGEWLGVWSSDVGPSKNGRHFVAKRDYGLFTELAQVRGDSRSGVYPRNLPIDVSRLAWLQFMQAPTDHHSPSHMMLSEFLDVFKRVRGDSADYRPDFAAYDLFGVDPDWPEGCDYRVVFWFDN